MTAEEARPVGYRRKLDRDNRLVVPIEILGSVGAGAGAEFELMRQGAGDIVLRRVGARNRCAICGAEGGLTPVRTGLLCRPCLTAAANGVR